MFLKIQRTLTLFAAAATAVLFCFTLALAAKPDKPDGGGGPLANPAFVYRKDFKALFLTNLDGSATQQLAQPKSKQVDKAPVWSPDGSMIAFLRHPDKRLIWVDLYVINSDGSGLTRIRSFDEGPIFGKASPPTTLAWSESDPTPGSLRVTPSGR